MFATSTNLLLDKLHFSEQDKMHDMPAYQLICAGENMKAHLQDRLISLTLTDNRGFEADQLDIELDDSDGLIALPKRNAQIAIALGWKKSGLVDKGTFIVDEIEHSGSPDRLMIRARSANMTDGLITQRERSFHQKTVGDIVRTIAAEHQISAVISPALDKKVIAHFDQANESDANLLSRLAKLFDAIATIKQNKLLFMPLGETKTASGKALPRMIITRASGDNHRFSIAGRDNYMGVKAYYQDKQLSKRGEVIVGKKANATKEGEKLVGSPKQKKIKLLSEKKVPHDDSSQINDLSTSAANQDTFKVLRYIYANQKNAYRAAQAEWKRLQRGIASFSMTLARGQPELLTEMPVNVYGWKPEIDNANWIVTRVVHTFSSGSYTTAIELEVKLGTTI